MKLGDVTHINRNIFWRGASDEVADFPRDGFFQISCAGASAGTKKSAALRDGFGAECDY
jgi:hypothetical protein